MRQRYLIQSMLEYDKNQISKSIHIRFNSIIMVNDDIWAPI